MYILKVKSVAQAEQPRREPKESTQAENRDPLKCFTFQGVSAH